MKHHVSHHSRVTTLPAYGFTLPEDLLATTGKEKFPISPNLAFRFHEAPGPEAVQTLKGIKRKHHQQLAARLDQPNTFQINANLYKHVLVIHMVLRTNKFASHR